MSLELITEIEESTAYCLTRFFCVIFSLYVPTPSSMKHDKSCNIENLRISLIDRKCVSEIKSYQSLC